MQGKSRILLFTTAFLPMVGGSEIAIDEIAKRLPDFEFDIVTAKLNPQWPSHEVRNNINIYRVGNGPSTATVLLPKNFLPLALFFKARQLNNIHRYQTIHAYQASQAAGAAWLFKLFNPKVRFIVTIQEGKDLKSQSWLLNFFRNIIIRKADAVTVISNYLGRYAKKINSHASIVLIPNGVDTNLFKTLDKEMALRNLSWPVEKPIIMTVSRLVEKNGLADLLAAFARLDARNRGQLVIIGSGPLESSLKKQAVELKIQHTVQFLGEIPYHRIPEYLTAADIFVRPSLSEGLGTAFLEAMACGVPVIGTPVGGIPDFLTHGVTGLICKPHNPENLAMAIKKLIEDIPLRERFGTAGRALVEASYTWTVVAAKMKTVYHE